MVRIEYMPGEDKFVVIQQGQGALLLTKEELQQLASDIQKAFQG